MRREVILDRSAGSAERPVETPKLALPLAPISLS